MCYVPVVCLILIVLHQRRDCAVLSAILDTKCDSVTNDNILGKKYRGARLLGKKCWTWFRRDFRSLYTPLIVEFAI